MQHNFLEAKMPILPSNEIHAMCLLYWDRTYVAFLLHFEACANAMLWLQYGFSCTIPPRGLQRNLPSGCLQLNFIFLLLSPSQCKFQITFHYMHAHYQDAIMFYDLKIIWLISSPSSAQNISIYGLIVNMDNSKVDTCTLI